MGVFEAEIKCSKAISKLMLSELKIYESRFPKKMIKIFREHAKEENIVKEFKNQKLIAFVAKNKEKIVGFIVGYEDSLKEKVMIHYIASNETKIKKELLDRFIKECRLKKVKQITTDTFEFMANKNFFELNKFILMKKEEVTPNLEMLWYKLDLN